MLEGVMVKTRLFRIIMFLLITWTIINSVLIPVEIYFLAIGKWAAAWRYFVDIYCLGGIPKILAFWFPPPLDLASHISQRLLPLPSNSPFLFQQFLFALLVLVLWLRRQTIFRAFLLAVAGILANPLFFYILVSSSQTPLTASMLTVLAFYLLLALLNMAREDYAPNMDLSRYLFWRKPWSKT